MSRSGCDDRVIPLVEEEVTVEKRPVDTGRVVISTKVEERREWVEETLRREDVTVERVPIGQVVTGTVPSIREDGDVLIVPVLAEELVIEKRLVLREELHIRKNVRLEQVREPVIVRAETAVITREEVNPSD